MKNILEPLTDAERVELAHWRGTLDTSEMVSWGHISERDELLGFRALARSCGRPVPTEADLLRAELALVTAERDAAWRREEVAHTVEHWPDAQACWLIEEAFRLATILREQTEGQSVHDRCTFLLGEVRMTLAEALNPPPCPFTESQQKVLLDVH